MSIETPSPDIFEAFLKLGGYGAAELPIIMAGGDARLPWFLSGAVWAFTHAKLTQEQIAAIAAAAAPPVRTMQAQAGPSFVLTPASDKEGT